MQKGSKQGRKAPGAKASGGASSEDGFLFPTPLLYQRIMRDANVLLYHAWRRYDRTVAAAFRWITDTFLNAASISALWLGFMCALNLAATAAVVRVDGAGELLPFGSLAVAGVAATATATVMTSLTILGKLAVGYAWAWGLFLIIFATPAGAQVIECLVYFIGCFLVWGLCGGAFVTPFMCYGHARTHVGKMVQLLPGVLAWMWRWVPESRFLGKVLRRLYGILAWIWQRLTWLWQRVLDYVIGPVYFLLVVFYVVGMWQKNDFELPIWLDGSMESR